MRKILYIRPNDNGITIVIPVSKEKVEETFGSLSEEEYENHVWERSVPIEAISPRFIEEIDIPNDRVLRNAWEDNQGKIVESLEKSQLIVRDARNRALEALDMRAVAEERKPNGNTLEINSASEMLRNIPQRPEFTSTLDSNVYKLMLIEIEKAENL